MMQGGCLCGQIRYRINSAPIATVLCHCTHCQKQSGSAFSTNVIVPEADVAFTGTETAYQDTGDSGGSVERRFCARCGSPVRSLIKNMPGVIAIKAGTLDDASSLIPVMQIWRRSAQGWLDQLPDIAAHETNPPAG